MNAPDYLFIAGLLLLALAGFLWPMPTESEIREAAGSIDYRPSVLQARQTFADVATSPRRNAVFLTDTQQAELMPGASEIASRRAVERMLGGSR